VRLSGGEATAFAVFGSKLLVFPGMGHDLPATVQPVIAEEMALLAARADGDR
jgi:hypothetical protein